MAQRWVGLPLCCAVLANLHSSVFQRPHPARGRLCTRCISRHVSQATAKHMPTCNATPAGSVFPTLYKPLPLEKALAGMGGWAVAKLGAPASRLRGCVANKFSVEHPATEQVRATGCCCQRKGCLVGPGGAWADVCRCQALQGMLGVARSQPVSYV